MSKPLVKRHFTVRRKDGAFCIEQKETTSRAYSTTTPLERMHFMPSKSLMHHVVVGMIQAFLGVLFIEFIDFLEGPPMMVELAPILYFGWYLGKLNYDLDLKETEIVMLKWLQEEEDAKGE